jgi:pentapeptide MXKDX repeat protein
LCPPRFGCLVTSSQRANLTFALAFQGQSIVREKFMSKLVSRIMAVCLLGLSLCAFAQSSGGEMKHDDNMKQDSMKHDEMKKDEMKKEKKTKKAKKDKMKKDEMKGDEMKHDDMKKN